jgi:hypothetical protein
VSADKQPVQHCRHWCLGILVDPGVIVISVRAINAAGGLFTQKPERIQLLPGHRHWYCPSPGRVL